MMKRAGFHGQYNSVDVWRVLNLMSSNELEKRAGSRKRCIEIVSIKK